MEDLNTRDIDWRQTRPSKIQSQFHSQLLKKTNWCPSNIESQLHSQKTQDVVVQVQKKIEAGINHHLFLSLQEAKDQPAEATSNPSTTHFSLFFTFFVSMQFLKCRQDFWEFCACESFMLNRLGFLILEVSSLGVAVAPVPVIWSFSQPSSHTWRCNSWTRCQMCHMWKMSHLSHVSRDTVRLLLFLVYHFECNRSSVHHFGCIYPPFGDSTSSGCLIRPSPGMQRSPKRGRSLCAPLRAPSQNKSKHYNVQLPISDPSISFPSERFILQPLRRPWKWAVPRYRTVV